MMLTLIVDAAVRWMEAGLPLKLLKIVLFARDPKSPGANVARTMQSFEQLRTKWTEKWKEKALQAVCDVVSLFLFHQQSSLGFECNECGVDEDRPILKTLRLFLSF